ncbi:MAG: acyl-CoA dehydrogenase family protein [bacterium JZ-2024 1]
MDFLLSKENLEFKEKARAIAEQVVRPHAALWDEEEKYPYEAIEALRKEGLLGVWIPKEYGGLGAGVLNLCIVVEELSRVDGGTGVAYAVNALASFPIIVGGTEEQKKKWLPDVASGKVLMAFALSEKEAGSDAGSLKATAKKEGDSYIIEGDKKWTTGAEAARRVTVFAKTNPELGVRGISAFVVDRDTPGFTVGKAERKMGIRCVPVNETHFHNCKVPADHLLGGKEGMGFAHAMMTLDYARPGVAAQAVGLAQGAYEIALAWAKERRQFGQPISANQAIAFYLADMATWIEAARQLVYASARMLDMGHSREASKYSAMAKVFASDVAMKVTTLAVQIMGGYGYIKDYPAERFMRDAKITQIYEGTNEIQRLVISRSILK